MRITPEQEALFREAFNGGLTSVGKAHATQLASLAEKTGLTLQFVKVKQICIHLNLSLFS